MSFTYDTEPTTSYAKDSATSIAVWSDIDILWADPLEGWGIGGTPFTYDAEADASALNWFDMTDSWANTFYTWGDTDDVYLNDNKPTL